jgi:hypothetical protein
MDVLIRVDRQIKDLSATMVNEVNWQRRQRVRRKQSN